MIVSGRNLSLIGRAALPNAGGARASQRPAPDPVEPAGPLKDPTSTDRRDLQWLPPRDRELPEDPRALGAADREIVSGSARPALAAYRETAASGVDDGVVPGRLDVIV